MSHRETELRGGTWPIEDERLPPQLRPSGCCQLAKVARKVANIVRNDKAREVVTTAFVEVLLHITEHADSSANEVKVVQNVTTDCRVLRRALR